MIRTPVMTVTNSMTYVLDRSRHFIARSGTETDVDKENEGAGHTSHYWHHPSACISGCLSEKCGGPTSISDHNLCNFTAETNRTETVV